MSKYLEADGCIGIYDLNNGGSIIAQYEGLEVHEAMQELAALREQVRELEAVIDQASTDCLPLLSMVDDDPVLEAMVTNICNNLLNAIDGGAVEASE